MRIITQKAIDVLEQDDKIQMKIANRSLKFIELIQLIFKLYKASNN